MMFRYAFVLLIAALPLPAIAQYAGPGVKTCQALAERDVQKNNQIVPRVVIDSDADLLLEKSAQNVGSQAVTFILRGNGALVLKNQPATEFTFVCLLADENRAVNFDWISRHDAPVLAQCRRNASAAAEIDDCFEKLQRTADLDLLAASADRFQAAIDADRAAGGTRADSFREAAAAWRAFREIECRSVGAMSGAHAADAQRACTIQMIRHRALELREKR